MGGGLCALMAMATLGSLSITAKERGDVEITPAGVRRIYSPGREEFFPRDQIAGYRIQPQGGVALLAVDGSHEVVISRNLLGYRDCIAELNALGIHNLARKEMTPRQRGSRTWSQTILGFAFGWLCIFFLNRHTQAWEHHLAGAMIVLAAAVFSWRESQKPRSILWVNILLAAIALIFIIYRW